MIITRIKASNVLKYEKLDLSLPEKGLIAISGQNESGKSSIGEAVCFALFGRTFSIEPEDVKKVVRWGENHCAVTLFFKIDSQTYELARFLDTDGNHSAKLTRAGEEDPLARGVAPVGEKLVELLGFEYEQFVESFYLAQREITTPHPHSQAVKIMAGIEPLEGVVGELEREIEERNDLLEDMQAECDAVDQEIDELGIHPGHLQNLENDRLEAVDQADRVRVLHEEMGQRLDVYCKNTRAIYKASSARSRGRSAAVSPAARFPRSESAAVAAGRADLDCLCGCRFRRTVPADVDAGCRQGIQGASFACRVGRAGGNAVSGTRG